MAFSLSVCVLLRFLISSSVSNTQLLHEETNSSILWVSSEDSSDDSNKELDLGKPISVDDSQKNPDNSSGDSPDDSSKELGLGRPISVDDPGSNSNDPQKNPDDSSDDSSYDSNKELDLGKPIAVLDSGSDSDYPRRKGLKYDSDEPEESEDARKFREYYLKNSRTFKKEVEENREELSRRREIMNEIHATAQDESDREMEAMAGFELEGLDRLIEERDAQIQRLESRIKALEPKKKRKDLDDDDDSKKGGSGPSIGGPSGGTGGSSGGTEGSSGGVDGSSVSKVKSESPLDFVLEKESLEFPSFLDDLE